MTHKTRYRILGIIKSYTSEHDRPPTIRDIAGAAGVSVSTVIHHLRHLESEGLIEITPFISRGIRVTKKGDSKEVMPAN